MIRSNDGNENRFGDKTLMLHLDAQKIEVDYLSFLDEVKKDDESAGDCDLYRREFLAEKTNLSCCDRCGIWGDATNDLWWTEFGEEGETPFGRDDLALTQQTIDAAFDDGNLALCESCCEHYAKEAKKGTITE